MNNVFVYGTLKKGYGNHRLLEGSEVISEEASTYGDMYSLGGFPGTKKNKLAKSLVFGEVYSVDDETLKRLDRLEGHPNFFERKFVEVYSSNGEGKFDELKAWIYFYKGEVSKERYIESGIWKGHYVRYVIHN